MSAPIDPQTQAALQASTNERIQAQIQAATNKRTTAKRKRAQRAVARNAGLDARHRAKLARLQQPTDTPKGVHE